MIAPCSFDELLERSAAAPACNFVVAGGESAELVEAIELCKSRGIEGFTLVGDLPKISWLLATHTLDDDVHVEPSDNPAQDALRLCLALPRPVLVKGKVDSATLLRSVLGSLPKEERPFLSHCTLLRHPKANQLLLLTDTGLNVSPDLTAKARILDNALCLLRRIGIEQPRVLLAAGMEDKGQSIPAITDAKELVRQHRDEGRWNEAVVAGPYGLDIGLTPEAVAAKGIGEELGGLAHVVLAPNIEAANFAAKMAGIIMGPPWAGIIVGGPYPIVVGSRSDPPESRLASLALARLLA